VATSHTVGAFAIIPSNNLPGAVPFWERLGGPKSVRFHQGSGMVETGGKRQRGSLNCSGGFPRGCIVGYASTAAGPRYDLLGYQLALKAAEDRGDKKGVADLKRVGPPPYHSFEDVIVQKTYTNPPGLPPTPQEIAGYATLAKLLGRPAPTQITSRGLPPYDGAKVFLNTSKAMFEQEERWDPFQYPLSFSMPVMILNGDGALPCDFRASKALRSDSRVPIEDWRVLLTKTKMCCAALTKTTLPGRSLRPVLETCLRHVKPVEVASFASTVALALWS